MDLCTTADVEALLGHTIAAEDTARVAALITMASAVVGAQVTSFPDEASVPEAVSYVTASLVVRIMANPGHVQYEMIGTYSVRYPDIGLGLTEGDMAILEPWLRPNVGAYSVATPRPVEAFIVPPPFDWERDLDGAW